MLDPVDEVSGQRDGRLEYHSPQRLRGSRRAAVEAEPCSRVDELAVAIDEVGDPQRAIAEEDRDFAALAATKQLALHGMRSALIGISPQCHSFGNGPVRHGMGGRTIPAGLLCWCHERILMSQAVKVLKKLRRIGKS